MKNETLLHEEIKSGFESLNNVKKGSDEYKTIIDAQTKLIDKAIEIDKLNIEHEEFDKKLSMEIDKLRTEHAEKENQLKEEKIDRNIKHSLTAISVIGGLVTTWHWSKKTFKFEETGTITTLPGRNFINKAINFFKK